MVITECNPTHVPGAGTLRTRRIPPPTAVRIAVVHPADEHLVVLLRTLRGSGFRSDWAPDCEDALMMLAGARFPVLICERELQDGCWRDILAQVKFLPRQPLVIVTSMFADERLWAEVLNLGGYDVLRKPFQEKEVMRMLDQALRWRPISLLQPFYTSMTPRPRRTG